MNRQALCAAALLTALPAALAAQELPAPTFRGGVESVDVDVIVTGRDGGVVRGLTPDDFELFEDGVRQEIRTFSFVDLPTTYAADGTAGAAADGGADGRRFIMVLDGYGPRLTRIARMFVDRALGPNDEMSVYYNHPVSQAFVEGQAFTASKPLLRAAIRTVEPAFWPLQMQGMLSRGAYEGERLRIALERFETLRQAMEEIATTPGRRKAILWFGSGLWFDSGLWAADADPLQVSERTPDTPSVQVAFAYRDVIRAAVRHNVVIYPIDPTGLTTRLGGRELQRMSELRGLAQDTGVEAIVGTNDYQKGYSRIVREMSTYYLLGYEPPIHHPDGRFHAIRVRVKRPGVRVRSRKGYFAEEPVRSLPALPRPPAAAEAALDELALSVRRSPEPGEAPTPNRDGRPAPPLDGSFGEPHWSRAARPGAPYVRTTDPRFTRTERLRLEIPTTASAPATARLLDRLGSPMRVPALVTGRPSASGDFRWIVVDVSLAPLAPADYLIEVTQEQAASVAAFRIVP